MDVPEHPDPFRRLVEIVQVLRSDDGCPWDREQTMESMVEHIREETEEVVEAVESGDMENLKEELGDVILQAVFYAQLADERDLFTVDDVLNRIGNKLVSRHPHVFGDMELNTAEEVLDQWEEIKAKEKEITSNQ